MRIEDRGHYQFGDDGLVFCPVCGQRASEARAAEAVEDPPSGMLCYLGEPLGRRLLLEPCGHVVDSLNYRATGGVIDAIAVQRELEP